MIWMIFAVMVAAALALLLPPLLKPRAATAASRADYDITVYKDQLAEVERDMERGLLTHEQAGSARTEIQRRMLGAGDAGKSASPRKAVKAAPARTAALAVAVLVPVVALSLYVILGSPALPDRPYEGRGAEMSRLRDQTASVEGMVAKLAERLAKTPQDGKGWAMLGRSYRVLGDSAKARESYRKAIALLPGDVQTRVEYGALLLDETDSPLLPDEFVTVMKDVLALDPQQGDALYFLGMAESQAGRPDAARALWTRLLDTMPPDAPERQEIAKLIEGLR